MYKTGIIFFIYLLVACSSGGRKEVVTTRELLQQAAFYGDRLQFLPALDTYRQAISLAEREEDSVALSFAYQGMGGIFRNQSLKQEALQSGKRALCYAGQITGDSLRMAIYRDMGDVYRLSGEADSAFYYYQMGGYRIGQAKILQQRGNSEEAEILLKAELGQGVSEEGKAELYLALADFSWPIGRSRKQFESSAFFPSTFIYFSVPDCRKSWR